jgi:hypothetical protein
MNHVTVNTKHTQRGLGSKLFVELFTLAHASLAMADHESNEKEIEST